MDLADGALDGADDEGSPIVIPLTGTELPLVSAVGIVLFMLLVAVRLVLGLGFDKLYVRLTPHRWRQAFEAGVFTEFMEQRAPGHTVADGKIYEKGLLDLKTEIAAAV